MTTIVQKFTTPDGQQFDTMKEAQDHLRLPKIRAAMTVVTNGNTELVEWLIANQESVEMAFESGTIKRVTKAEKKKLEKALDAVKEIQGNPKLAFLQENTGAVLESFRWPSVKRMSEEEKAVAARNTLMAASENNEELANFVLAKKDEILNAFEAGKEKREVPASAAAGLAAYRAKKAAEKEAAEKAAAEKAAE